MKKLFLIIFLVIGFRAYSQNYDENGYQEVNIKAATSLTVQTSGTTLTLDTTSFARIVKSNRDTVASSPDTLSRLPGNFSITAVRDTGDNVNELGITRWYGLIICPSDTIVVSSSVTFNNGDYWIIYPNEAWTTPKYSRWIQNYFWKTLFTGGHTGTAAVRWDLWGY